MYTTSASSTPNPLMTNIGSNTTTEETTESKAVDTAVSSPTVAETKSETSRDLVNFSERAKKIQSIAKDFFSNGQLSSADIPKYIKRLEKDGFLTEVQAEKLSVDYGQETDELGDETKKILDFIGEFKDKVSEKDPQDTLIAALERAEKTIEELGSGYDASMAKDIKTSLMEIESYLNSDKIEQWDEQDIKSLKDVKNILATVDQMSTKQTSSTAVNRYLQFSGNNY